MTRLGIYGGTFAPVHLGHVHAVNEILKLGILDRLLLMPTRKPPHKSLTRGDDPIHRLAMLRLAFPRADTPGSLISVSEYELTAPPPSYTANTLTHFASPDTELTFFCGTDMFLTLDSWYHPETIFSLARIVHLPRVHLTEDDRAEIVQRTARYEEAYGARILHPDIPPLPLSSTAVRQAIREGRNLSRLIPDGVAGYLTAHGLYLEEEI